VNHETNNEAVQEEILEEQAEQTEQEVEAQPEAEETPAESEQAPQQDDRYLRLAAEYDNYRKRTAKEKEALWSAAKADTVATFLPVYDNLERAIKQETADEAYKKGVEMTMNQLKEVFAKLGVTEIPALGEPFDPNLHNAVMHEENPEFGENEISMVLQQGWKRGEKILRYAMVKTAN